LVDGSPDREAADPAAGDRKMRQRKFIAELGKDASVLIYRWRTSDVTPSPVTPPAASDMTDRVFEVSFMGMRAGGGAPAEFWTDVSLATLPATGDDMEGFTFDRFLNDGQVEPPTEAIKEDVMGLEARARIIAVSLPIKVHSRG
jgi:hypothetical protein